MSTSLEDLKAHLAALDYARNKAIDRNDESHEEQLRKQIQNLIDTIAERERSHAVHANQLLSNAAGHLSDRAITYDNPAGERSMADTVALFNLFTGHKITESEGWRFMVFLKLVRSKQGKFKADNHEDAVAYEALAAEALQKEKSSG